MDKINDLIEELITNVKNNNESNIKQLKHKMIHPDDGAYFVVAYKNKSDPSSKWRLQLSTLFESKNAAENHLNRIKTLFKNNEMEYSVIRAALFETNINGYL